MTSPARNYKSLERGEVAPPFALPASSGGTIALDDHLGKHTVLLCFYFGDFTSEQREPDRLVATAAVSLSALSEEADAFRDANTHILGVSRDSLESHVALIDLLKLRIPLLSDAGGDAGTAYGLLPDTRWAGSSYNYDRYSCVFLIDKNGIVQYRQVTDLILSRAHPIPADLRAKLGADLRLWLGTPRVLYTSRLLEAARLISA